MAFLGALLAAAASNVSGQQLPDLGGASDAALPYQLERRIGESIMREVRTREASYLDDPEIAAYLGDLGARLAQATPGARQDFEFFAVRDPAVNAFALPGGFVGVHSGLVTTAETESELASVLAHEIAHVSQRHIARMIAQEKQMQLPSMIALAAAILLGASRPDLAVGAAAAAQGVPIQQQLGYSRDFEREADRIGLQALSGAGFDARAMSVFFEKLQRATRVSDDGSVPGYLRTHPLTTERIADMQNRAASLPYRQRLDSLEFHLVRAKLRAESRDARDAVAQFESAVRDQRYANETAARYGLVTALVRARRAREAETELSRLRATRQASPMLETLAARVRQALGDSQGALAILAEAKARYSYWRPLAYAQVSALLDAGRNDEALAALQEPLRLDSRDARLYALQAKTYAVLGKRLLQHQAQAEAYALQGSLPAAIEQLQLAQSAGDGDFYQLSVVEARLKDLRGRHAQELRDERGRR